MLLKMPGYVHVSVSGSNTQGWCPECGQVFSTVMHVWTDAWYYVVYIHYVLHYGIWWYYVCVNDGSEPFIAW